MGKKIIAIFIIFGFLVMTIYPKEIFSAACSGVNLWFNILFPAIFPSMLGIRFMSAIGISDKINTVFGGFMKIFGIRNSGFEAFSGGFLSGFPTGAKITGEMLEEKKITKEEAEKIFFVSNNPGIFFVISTVGAGILKDSECGYILLFCIFLSSVISGIIICRRYKRLYKSERIINKSKNFDFFMFRDIVIESMDAITRIGGFIILFSVISRGVSCVIPFNAVGDAVFSGIMEMTGGTAKIAALDISFRLKAAMISAVISFGGFSVIGQCMSMINKGTVSLKKFIRVRILNGMAAFLISFFVFSLLGK